MNYTDEERQRGYSLCKTCSKCVKLLQAGFDVETHACAMCKEHVADIDDFTPKTELVEKLISVRNDYINSGGRLLSAEELDAYKNADAVEILGK